MNFKTAIIPETNLQIMEHLHTFRFLTAPQLFRLGVASHLNSVRRALRRFDTNRKLVDFDEFGALPRIGKLPRIYYLTHRGAKCLAEAWRVDQKEINYPRGVKLFSRDYFHRVATIDFHVELRLFSEKHDIAVEFFHTYFDTKGANRNTKPGDRLERLTKIPMKDGVFIPDGVFAVRTPDGERYLFSLEIYNGRDTKRVHQQLEKHLLCLREGSITELYGFQKANRVLCVFESEPALRAIEKRLAGDEVFSAAKRQFSLTTLPRIRENFAAGWVFLAEGRRTIFDTKRKRGEKESKKTASESHFAHKGVLRWFKDVLESS